MYGGPPSPGRGPRSESTEKAIKAWVEANDTSSPAAAEVLKHAGVTGVARDLIVGPPLLGKHDKEVFLLLEAARALLLHAVHQDKRWGERLSVLEGRLSAVRDLADGAFDVDDHFATGRRIEAEQRKAEEETG